MNGWLIFLGLLMAHMLLLVWLVRSGRMQKWDLSLILGIILMIRTGRGRKTLEVISRPTRFWNFFGDIGIVLTYVGMAAMTLLMLALIPTVISPDSGVEPLGASEILVIPGVNPFVPLWYGLAALIITLVVHEGGHGVLAIANKMRLKSIGLLYAVVPVGAFVEPDEDDLMEAPRRARLRVYAAGATVNIFVAAITLAIFASMVGAAVPIDGAPLAGIVEGQPADLAGFEPGDIIVGGDDVGFEDWDAFSAFMGEHDPGDTVQFSLYDGRQITATLGDRWSSLSSEDQQFVLQENATLAEEWQKDAFLGVRPVPEVHSILSQPLGDGGVNFLIYLSLPLGEVRGTPYLGSYLPDFHEAPFAAEWFWPLATLAFWVSWINLMVGLTNVLPWGILDGGHLFRDGVAGLMERIRPKMDVEKRERIVGGMARTASLLIFTAFMLQIFGPRLAQAFA